MYTVLWCHEDGLNVRQFTKEELLEELDPNNEFSYLLGSKKMTWHTDIVRGNYELMNHCYQGIIIKGEIVVPRTKQIVTEEFDID